MKYALHHKARNAGYALHHKARNRNAGCFGESNFRLIGRHYM
ncbi:hypothetical protein LTSEJOH_6187 [Salmonella enterica subsp. enterica serovar Johannesburg str. S5-703]|nr:hypothetical protein LTSEJOH_6187 [Salmonella enterica subsp. enterica serovar Johannesburg str. S5-703]